MQEKGREGVDERAALNQGVFPVIPGHLSYMGNAEEECCGQPYNDTTASRDARPCLSAFDKNHFVTN